MDYEICDVAVLAGLTLAKIEINELDGTEILFHTTDGRVFKMFHIQDCCEEVILKDIVGDLRDLVGPLILRAEKRSNENTDLNDDLTWTFFEVATINGSVTISWTGESNGYYSEDVDFVEMEELAEYD